MGHLIALQGPEVGRAYPLDGGATILGRQHDSTICLPGRAISRHHARIVHENNTWVIEDLDSSNGTFVNGQRLPSNTRVPLTERDTLQIGPYVFGLRLPATTLPSEPNLIIRETVNAVTMPQGLLEPDAASRLQVVLDIAHQLGRSSDIQELLDQLLAKVMQLFPQADRALVVLCEGENLVLRGQQARRPQGDEYLFSRTIVRR